MRDLAKPSSALPDPSCAWIVSTFGACPVAASRCFRCTFSGPLAAESPDLDPPGAELDSPFALDDPSGVSETPGGTPVISPVLAHVLTAWATRLLMIGKYCC